MHVKESRRAYATRGHRQALVSGETRPHLGRIAGPACKSAILQTPGCDRLKFDLLARHATAHNSLAVKSPPPPPSISQYSSERSSVLSNFSSSAKSLRISTYLALYSQQLQARAKHNTAAEVLQTCRGHSKRNGSMGRDTGRPRTAGLRYFNGVYG